MSNENRTRLLLFAAVAAVHVVAILFVAFSTRIAVEQPRENARVMQLADFAEIVPAPPEPVRLPPPPPPPQNPPDEAVVESIAETMLEVETVPDQTVVAPGTLSSAPANVGGNGPPSMDDYLPQRMLSEVPRFNEREIQAALVFPPIALRSGIEGRVILELFIDANGLVRRVIILREEPDGRGFGEAAERAFVGRQGTPAMADGVPVSSRFRYPVSFRIR